MEPCEGALPREDGMSGQEPVMPLFQKGVDLQDLMDKGLRNAASGLSDMLSEPITLSDVELRLIPIEAAVEGVGNLETPAVGIYLLGTGDMPSRFMFVLPLDTASRLVDILLMQPAGTTTALDDLGRSALAEVGNMVASFFLNQVADLTGTDIRPSPPAIIVDMLGAVLDVILLPAGLYANDILLLDAVFHCGVNRLDLAFWLVPDLPESLLPYVQEMIRGR